MDRKEALALFPHRFVPATGDRARLALLLLHGTGGDENDLLPLGPLLARGAALLSPRGRVLEGAMPRWFRRVTEGVFDVPDLKRRTAELLDFVAAARAAYQIEGVPLVAAGFSNGANIAGGILLIDPAALDGAILLRAMTPFTPETPPLLTGKPVFLGAGRYDPLSRPDETERWAATLRGYGADVTLHWSPIGHALSEEDVSAAAAWIVERFGG
ncbi:MAG: alpha/beta hydrolase [Hyphomicrobiales bacterium]